MTDARKGEDGVKVADFNTKNWNMVLILDSNSKVRTAFVWEYDGTTPGVGDGFDFDWNLDNHGEFVTLYGYQLQPPDYSRGPHPLCGRRPD